MRATPLCLICVLGCTTGQERVPGPDLPDGGVAARPAALVIKPSDVTVTVRNGQPESVVLEASGLGQDGSPVGLVGPVTWSSLPPALGSVDATGRFVPSGTQAGEATVAAVSGELRAEAKVRVRVEVETRAPDVPEPSIAVFQGVSSSRVDGESPTLLYPLGGAVIPRALRPMDIQWEGGSEGDLFRVTLACGGARATAYLKHSGVDFGAGWQPEPQTWAMLLSSGSSLEVEVERWSAQSGRVFRSERHVLKVAAARLEGVIYYWDLDEGRIMRIGANGREPLMKSPPPKPGEPANRCVACHVVSRDGRYMAAELWGGDQPSTVFDLTKDLSGDPAPSVFAPSTAVRALFSTFSPDAKRLLISELAPGGGSPLRLIDPMTGAPVAAQGLPSDKATHPNWSPDGSAVAYIANTDTGPVDFRLGDLALLPVAPGDSFGAPVVLRPAEGLANSWPSFSPDSRVIAFGRGTHSRGLTRDAANVATVEPGELWLIDRAGGPPTLLDRANQGAARRSYLPNFSPFDEGGYFWLVFYSPRDYGNAKRGTKGTGRRQLWVSALENRLTPGKDPSNEAFWLPEQDVKTNNMSAFWALPPPIN